MNSFKLLMSAFFSFYFVFGFAQTYQWEQDFIGDAAGEKIGNAISINHDGTIIAVGSYESDVNGENSGYVKIFQRSGQSWVNKGDAFVGQTGDKIGYKIALNAEGDLLAIAEPAYDNYTGKVTVYAWDGTTWQIHGNTILGAATGDQLGAGLQLSGSGKVIAIGSPYSDIGGTSTGDIKVYELQNSVWTQKGSRINGTNNYDLLGVSFSIDSLGNTLAIGSYRNDNNGDNSGYCEIYEWESNSWTLKGTRLTGSNGEHFGQGIDISNDGKRIAIGAPAYEDANGDKVGRIQVYDWNENLTSWSQVGNDIEGDNETAGSGNAIALSNDIVAFGSSSHFNDSGWYAGEARVMEWNGSQWEQRGEALYGNNANDQLGYTIALNHDGSFLISGAIGADDNGSSSGQLKTYNYVLINGISTYSSSKNWQVFPTITKDFVTIRANETSQSQRVTVQLVSLNGQPISENLFPSNHQLPATYSLAHLPSGMYLLQISDGNETFTTKLIKE